MSLSNNVSTLESYLIVNSPLYKSLPNISNPLRSCLPPYISVVRMFYFAYLIMLHNIPSPTSLCSNLRRSSHDHPNSQPHRPRFVPSILSIFSIFLFSHPQTPALPTSPTICHLSSAVCPRLFFYIYCNPHNNP